MFVYPTYDVINFNVAECNTFCYTHVMKLKIDGLNIEWDIQKNSLNIRKHHISFKDAARIFFDKNRVELYDERHSEEEDRFITIGMVNEILFVVYTERLDTLRIISARIATPSEKEIYYGKNR